MSDQAHNSDQIRQRVRAQGWDVVSVPAQAGIPPHSYTAGLALGGLHEFIVFGFSPELARPVLSDLAQRLRDGERFPTNVGLEDVPPACPPDRWSRRGRADQLPRRRSRCVRHATGVRWALPVMNATSSRGRTATTKRFAGARSSSIRLHDPDGATERDDGRVNRDLQPHTLAIRQVGGVENAYKRVGASPANRMICKSFPDGRDSCSTAVVQPQDVMQTSTPRDL